MPKYLHDRIYHRSQLNKKFVRDIKGKKDVLILIDEIQVAAKENQTLHKAMEKCGFYNIIELLKRNIKIVEFTATPDGTIYDLMGWGKHSKIIKMLPGENYVSSYDLLKQGRILPCKDLCHYNTKTKKSNDEKKSIENIQEIKRKIEEKYDKKDTLYNLIRTPNSDGHDIVKENFEKIFGSGYEYVSYFGKNTYDINDRLKVKPKKHTFIFIKEKLRCAKTLHKKYIGILYERYVRSPNDSVIVQGFAGRLNGYDDNNKSICYTHIESVLRYEDQWNSDFKDINRKWKSNTTKRENNLLVSKGTYNNPELIDGITIDRKNVEVKEPIIKRCKTQPEITEYFNKIIKPKYNGSTGPRERKPNKDGFYETTLGRVRGTSVYSCEEIYQTRKWSLNNTHHYTYHPCYKNVNDKNTLEFWIIHY